MFKGKKTLITAVAVVLVLAIGGAVWAATNTAAAARTAPQLTTAQRNELVALVKQQLEIRRQIIKKQVEFKQLTAAQGKAAEANLDVRIENLANWDGTGPCPGMGPGMGMGYGRGGGRGPGGGRGMGGVCPNCGYGANNQNAQ